MTLSSPDRNGKVQWWVREDVNAFKGWLCRHTEAFAGIESVFASVRIGLADAGSKENRMAGGKRRDLRVIIKTSLTPCHDHRKTV